MKKTATLFLTIATTVLVTNCQSGSTDYSTSSYGSPSGGDRPLTEQELKEQLRGKECANPNSYLDGTLKYEAKYKNALSLKVKGLKINCRIRNNATLATFKDIRARAEFKSRTGAVIFTKAFTIYEYIAPGNSYTYRTEFGISNQQWKDISDFSWTIEDASCR